MLIPSFGERWGYKKPDHSPTGKNPAERRGKKECEKIRYWLVDKEI
jgi:hypothetical protein